MTDQTDLRPAARRMAALVRNVEDDQLGAPTPCTDTTLGDLLDHVGGLAVAFAAAARKEELDEAARNPSADASQLGDDWRERIPAALDDLAAAWERSEAWTGTTQAGPLEMPAAQAGLVALDELVLHGWDVARASGQDYDVDEVSLDGSWSFVAQFSGPGKEEERKGLFGPEIDVAQSAPRFDRLLGMAGRDPHWSPPTA